MRKIYKYLTSISLCIGIVLSFSNIVMASDSDELISEYSYYYIDEDFGTSNEVFIDDKAGLLSQDELDNLAGIMYYEGLAYGNMVFITTDYAFGLSASDYQWNVYNSIYGDQSDGVTFLIDMDNRKIWMQGYGSLSKKIDEDAANIIGDKIYTLASDEKYGECAIEGYRLIIRTLGGAKITGSLKYLGNACIAIITALVVTFLIAYIMSASRYAKDKDILDNIEKSINISNTGIKHTRTERIYDPPSSGSSSGGSSGGGGGGGGGHGF